MPEIQDLLDKARALGTALAAHPIVRQYHAAQRTMRADDEALELFQAYQRQAERIRQLEAENLNVGDSERAKLQTLQSRFAGNTSLKDLLKSQTEYVHLMSQVNQAMEAPLNALLQGENPA